MLAVPLKRSEGQVGDGRSRHLGTEVAGTQPEIVHLVILTEALVAPFLDQAVPIKTTDRCC